MIYFENVTISPDKKLTFTVRSTESSVHVTEIYVTTQDYFGLENSYKYTISAEDNVDITIASSITVVDDGADYFSNPFTYTVDMTTAVMKKADSDDKPFDLEKDLILLTAVTSETSENAVLDCCHKKPAYGIVYYAYCIYNKALAHLKNFCDDCTVNKGFIDFILKHKALDLACKCGDYVRAIKLWNWFYNKKAKSVITKNCGCNG